MHSITIVLKNGKEFTLKCKEYKLTKSKIDGSLIDFSFKGSTGECPIFINISNIEAIIETVEGE